MLRKALIIQIFLIACMATTASAVGVGVKMGTLGGGVEMEHQLTDSLAGRVGINYFSYSYDGTEDNINYDFDLNLMSVGAMLDWHPFENGFRITGGLLYNGNDIEANASGSDNATFDIGDTKYRSGDVGDLTGTIDFNSLAPYLGIGVSTAFGEQEQFGFLFELGAVYQGEATVDLSANGPIASNPVFINNLETEEQNLQDDMGDFQWYPVLSIGMIYRF